MRNFKLLSARFFKWFEITRGKKIDLAIKNINNLFEYLCMQCLIISK